MQKYGTERGMTSSLTFIRIFLLRGEGISGGGDGWAPCGVLNCTLRQVLEYLPQSTPTHSAWRVGAQGKAGRVRASFRPFFR